jgi:hypothetical protein
MNTQDSNVAEWVSEYPQSAHIIQSPILRPLFKRTPPPREETPEWTNLVASLASETSTGDEP